MDLHLQNLVSLLVVTLAAVYLVWRGRQFYLSLKTKSGTRCGGCSSCGTGSEKEKKKHPQITQIKEIKDIKTFS